MMNRKNLTLLLVRSALILVISLVVSQLAFYFWSKSDIRAFDLNSLFILREDSGSYYLQSRTSKTTQKVVESCSDLSVYKDKEIKIKGALSQEGVFVFTANINDGIQD